MNIKELKNSIKDLPDEMMVMVNENEITSMGTCVISKLQQEIGDYFSINTDYESKIKL